MKNNITLIAACALLSASCSISEENNRPSGTGVRFEVSAVNSLDSRAEAGIYSQEALPNSISGVSVYAFLQSGDDYTYYSTYDLTEWDTGDTSGEVLIPEVDEFPEGTYRFLAVGRKESDNFTLPALEQGVTSIDDFAVSIAEAGTETEIFAGETTAEISPEGTGVRILITRKVAGVMGYFKNIPAMVGSVPVKYLRLRANKANLSVNLMTGAGDTPTGRSQYVLDMDVSGQSVSDGLYTGNTAAAGVVKVENSQLLSTYLIPVSEISMELVLQNAEGGDLKSWTVQYGGSATFDIPANHLFVLGRKTAAANTDGGTPNNISDDDAPFDLSSNHDATIDISPSWDAVNNETLWEQ